jgi:hypothetical protein
VCPSPSTLGVATVFRFNGESLSQGNNASGDMRHFKDFPAGTTTKTTTAWEHIKTVTNTSVFDTSGTCMENFPPTVGFPCGGN